MSYAAVFTRMAAAVAASRGTATANAQTSTSGGQTTLLGGPSTVTASSGYHAQATLSGGPATATATASGGYHAQATLAPPLGRVYPAFKQLQAPKLDKDDELKIADGGRIVVVGPKWWDRIGNQVQTLIEDGRELGIEPTADNIAMLVLEQELPIGAMFNPVAARGAELLQQELIQRLTTYLEENP